MYTIIKEIFDREWLRSSYENLFTVKDLDIANFLVARFTDLTNEYEKFKEVLIQFQVDFETANPRPDYIKPKPFNYTKIQPSFPIELKNLHKNQRKIFSEYQDYLKSLHEFETERREANEYYCKFSKLNDQNYSCWFKKLKSAKQEFYDQNFDPFQYFPSEWKSILIDLFEKNRFFEFEYKKPFFYVKKLDILDFPKVENLKCI